MARPRDFDEAEVLDRAMEVFWRHGYEGASMAELTKAMRLNSPSIYAAFGSKRGLFDAVLGHYRNRRAANSEYVLSGRTAREVAERLVFDTIEWLTDPREPLGCLLVQSGLSAGVNNKEVPALLMEQRGGIKTALTARFVRAQAEGDLSDAVDAAALARYLHMVVLGLSIQAQEGMSAVELQESGRRALTGWPD